MDSGTSLQEWQAFCADFAAEQASRPAQVVYCTLCGRQYPEAAVEIGDNYSSCCNEPLSDDPEDCE